MSKPMTVVVTGGTGLVGKAIETVVARNKIDGESWVFLSSKDGDLRNIDQTKAIFAKFQPTHVIHLAAKVGGLFKNLNNKVEMWKDNVDINNNVMECCKEFKVDKLVSCLSTCVFPDKTTYPINETMLHNGPPHDSNAGYAYAKRLIDVLNRSYRDDFGCNFTSIIPTNIYGAHDNYHLEDSHVVPGLIHKFYLAKKEGKPQMTIWGSGKPLRQFIFAEDLAELTIWTLREYDSIEPIILSVGEQDEVSIGDVARMVKDAMGYEGELVFDTTKSDGQFKKTADNSKLMGLRPETKFVPMAEGIKRSVDWFVANYDTCRK